ncbi:MAG: hypothetical protein Fur0044_35960 [Anaerolineae bacterium]
MLNHSQSPLRVNAAPMQPEGEINCSMIDIIMFEGALTVTNIVDYNDMALSPQLVSLNRQRAETDSLFIYANQSANLYLWGKMAQYFGQVIIHLRGAHIF